MVRIPKCFVIPDHPGRSINGGFATSLLLSRPPLLFEEGVWARAPLARIGCGNLPKLTRAKARDYILAYVETSNPDDECEPVAVGQSDRFRACGALVLRVIRRRLCRIGFKSDYCSARKQLLR